MPAQTAHKKFDAGRGAVLMNAGKGGFNLLAAEESGVEINGQVRDIREIHTPAGSEYLFLRNDLKPVLFRLRNKTGDAVKRSARP